MTSVDDTSPVVPKAVADGLAVALEALLAGLQDGPENLSYLLYEELAEGASATLAKYKEATQ